MGTFDLLVEVMEAVTQSEVVRTPWIHNPSIIDDVFRLSTYYPIAQDSF